MTRVLIVWMLIGLVVALLVAPRLADEDHAVDAATTTTWPVESIATLPAGFDPAKLAPPAVASSPPVARRSKHPTAAGDVDWDAIADCESGDWDAHGNVIPGTARWDDRRAGYEGGLHFSHDTWIRAGGDRYALHAYDATRQQQIEIAAAWLERTSLEQWPVCSRKVGAR